MSEAILGVGVWSLMMSAGAAVLIFPFWFIFSKAGYSRWLSLLLLSRPCKTQETRMNARFLG